jgi:hypothetical protein
VYGNDPQLRAMLHERGVGSVLAVSSTHRVGAAFGAREVRAHAMALPTSVRSLSTREIPAAARGGVTAGGALRALNEKYLARQEEKEVADA